MKIRFSSKQIPLLVLIGFGIVLFTMGILNHYFFRTYAHDYANYNFALWDYAHFRISPLKTFKGTFLQDHFSFTLMYFVPVYWLLNWLTQTYTLILIQYSLVLVAAWYSYKIIKLKTDNLWLGVGVLVYSFVLLGRYTTFTADVNLAVISACFIPIFIYCFETKKYLIALGILILSLFSRENIPIWFVFIFIVLIIQHRKDKKAILYSLIGIAISIVYFILLFKVFIPSVGTPGIKFALFNYSALGATPGEAITFIINNPFESIKMFFINHSNDPVNDWVKAEFYWVYLISGGFVLLMKPQYLIWFIPIVAQKVLNDNPFRWGIGTYYSIEIVTLLPLSVFLVLSSLRSQKLQTGLAIALCIATITVTIHKLDQSNNKTAWAFNPSKSKPYDKRFFDSPFDIKVVNRLIKQIPPNAKVSASNYILPHLAQRQFIYFFPVVEDAEFIIFSALDDCYLFSHEINEENRNKFLDDPHWEIISKEYPLYLLRHRETLTNEELNLNRIWIRSDTLFCNYETMDIANGTILFANNQKAEIMSYLTSEKSHSESHSLKLTAERPFNTSFIMNDICNIAYLQISAWCYCDDNHANIVATSGKDFYISNNKYTTEEPSGWKKIVLNFLVPNGVDTSHFSIYLWNNGNKPIYFDDLQIIRKYMN